MNIQNVVALAAQLKVLGFEEMGSQLLQRICFKPDNFNISTTIIKDKERLSFEIYFEKDKKTDAYFLKFYDAILQKESPLPQTEIVGINILELQQKMKAINWKSAFDMSEKKQWSIENTASWENEAAIESAIKDLEKLESTEDGKAISNNLKLSFWSGIPDCERIVQFSNGKNKNEISQRFYLFEGQSGISVDEAYRFLQNRWLEKQMQQKKKQDDGPNEAAANDTPSSNGSGLLHKKRIVTTKRKLKTES
jgi:hypothetical protein